MKAIRKWISHNQGTFLAVIVVIGIGIWLVGCESKVSSMLEPTKKVNRAELKIEIDTIITRLEAELDMKMRMAGVKVTDLDRQDAIKQKLFDFAAITAEGQTVNPAGVIGLIFSILGVGALADNRIKDKVIKNRPLKE